MIGRSSSRAVSEQLVLREVDAPHLVRLVTALRAKLHGLLVDAPVALKALGSVVSREHGVVLSIAFETLAYGEHGCEDSQYGPGTRMCKSPCFTPSCLSNSGTSRAVPRRAWCRRKRLDGLRCPARTHSRGWQPRM